MKFVLDIRLGNEAMQTAGDVAAALRRAADELAQTGADIRLDSPADVCMVGIRDDNGNTVGSWAVTA